MTTLTIVKFFFYISLAILGSYVIYKEKDLIKFERKIKKYVKAFFKAAYYTILEKKNKNTAMVEEIQVQVRDEEYEQMLAHINKASQIDDVLVA